MFVLLNKVMLITGAANGIGATFVKLVLEEGIKHIAVLDIDEYHGLLLEDDMNKKHGHNKVKFLKCDVSKDKELFEAFKIVTEEQGYKDIVVNNAGTADESSPDAIRREIEINYTAVVNSTVKAIELMRKDHGGKGGTVVNISSIAGLCQPCPALFVYLGTKSAVMQFSNCIGKEEYFSRTGVRVVTVCFGVTNTEIVHNMRSFDDRINEELKEIVDLFPMQTLLSAAKGALDAVKNGTSASTWLVANDTPAKDITTTVQKAYGLYSDLLS